MGITLEQIIVWLVIGTLAGSFVGMLVKRNKEGFGRLTNLAIGLVGALLGGLLYERRSKRTALGRLKRTAPVA